MKYKKQYDILEPDFEVNESDYLVDETGYESIEDLLARCMRDRVPLPTQTPGLVEDLEADNDLVYDDRIDQALYPEDYEQMEPVKDTSDLQTNINEQSTKAENDDLNDDKA